MSNCLAGVLLAALRCAHDTYLCAAGLGRRCSPPKPPRDML